jgi:aminocarboxymuconate-semialdehyde decarboxylase
MIVMSDSVDVHAHLLIPAVDQLVAGRPGLAAAQALDLRRYGDPERMRAAVIPILPKLLDPAVRLSDMDSSGIGVQVVSPSPSHYHDWAEPALATEIYQAAHEGLAALLAVAPGRLRGLGLAPLQDTAVAIAALDHALDHGLLGVEISTHCPGRELSDPALEPFWAHAALRGAVIFVHPFGCTLDERLRPWYLGNIVGNPTETTVALSHLIFSGVLDRHPGLRIVAAHGGGYLPTYLGRSDHGWAVRSESHECADKPSSYVRRLWFDSLVHSPLVLRHLVETVGADRVMVGSDYPFDMGTDDPIGALTAAGLSDVDYQAVRSGTAMALFGL